MRNEHPDMRGLTPTAAFVGSMLFGWFYWSATALFFVGISVRSCASSQWTFLFLLVTALAGGLTGLLVYRFMWRVLRKKHERSAIIGMSAMGAITGILSLLLFILIVRSKPFVPQILRWLILPWPIFCGMGSCLILRRVLPDRLKPGCCMKCGYDLTGNLSGVCSECGTLIPRTLA
jgi:hypothetical protein